MQHRQRTLGLPGGLTACKLQLRCDGPHARIGIGQEVDGLCGYLGWERLVLRDERVQHGGAHGWV